MTSTDYLRIPYPEGTDPVDVASDLLRLAERLDAVMIQYEYGAVRNWGNKQWHDPGGWRGPSHAPFWPLNAGWNREQINDGFSQAPNPDAGNLPGTFFSRGSGIVCWSDKSWWSFGGRELLIPYGAESAWAPRVGFPIAGLLRYFTWYSPGGLPGGGGPVALFTDDIWVAISNAPTELGVGLSTTVKDRSGWIAAGGGGGTGGGPAEVAPGIPAGSTWTSDRNQNDIKSFTGSGALRPGTRVYYGYYTSIQGNQHGEVTLPAQAIAGVPVNRIASMRLVFYNEHTFFNGGGSVQVVMGGAAWNVGVPHTGPAGLDIPSSVWGAITTAAYGYVKFEFRALSASQNNYGFLDGRSVALEVTFN